MVSANWHHAVVVEAAALQGLGVHLNGAYPSISERTELCDGTTAHGPTWSCASRALRRRSYSGAAPMVRCMMLKRSGGTDRLPLAEE